jgi:hypothetical protein
MTKTVVDTLLMTKTVVDTILMITNHVDITMITLLNMSNVKHRVKLVYTNKDRQTTTMENHGFHPSIGAMTKMPKPMQGHLVATMMKMSFQKKKQ